ncbi:MAG: MBL fold metallo-hydrolase [Chloroflexota bacterium]|nr:MBL fold metallo-hydrolase [Chloroflexota bacterium]
MCEIGLFALTMAQQQYHWSEACETYLVDPCRHDEPPDPAFVPPQYQQPPGLLTQLLARGIDPGEITHLIITHTHIDHYAGVTCEYKGQVVPCFPNARCLLNQADWEMTALQHALLDPTSLESRTLGVLWKAGMLEIIEGNVDLLPHVQIWQPLARHAVTRSFECTHKARRSPVSGTCTITGLK